MTHTGEEDSKLCDFHAGLRRVPSEVTSPAVIFDMDGTLVDVTSLRRKWLGGDPPRRDFNSFHRESVNAAPIPWVRQAALEASSHGMSVVIVSGRSVRWRAQTAWWLALHAIPSDALLLRAENDGRSDALVKADMLARIQRHWEPIWAFDDNPQTIAVWLEQDIPVTVVPGWESY